MRIILQCAAVALLIGFPLMLWFVDDPAARSIWLTAFAIAAAGIAVVAPLVPRRASNSDGRS